MAESNENEIHVRDNRTFNPDGSLREGASLEDKEPVKPKQEIPKQEVPKEAAPKPEVPPLTEEEPVQKRTAAKVDFPTFILSLASSVQISMGMVPHPVTGQMEADFEHAQQTIDILGMLEEKTQGNLTPEESGLLKQVLFQLRMQFVEMKKRVEQK